VASGSTSKNGSFLQIRMNNGLVPTGWTFFISHTSDIFIIFILYFMYEIPNGCNVSSNSDSPFLVHIYFYNILIVQNIESRCDSDLPSPESNFRTRPWINSM